MSGPALDGDRALISSKRIVEQVHFTVHLCVYDHRVPHSAITVHHQVMGAVLHGCVYPTMVRDNNCVRRMSTSWWQVVWSRLTHWSHGALGSTLCLPVGSLHHIHTPTCSMPAQDRATSVGQNQKWKWLRYGVVRPFRNVSVLTSEACRRLIRRRFLVSCCRKDNT